MIANQQPTFANVVISAGCCALMLLTSVSTLLAQDEIAEPIPPGDVEFGVTLADEGLLLPSPELELLDEPAEKDVVVLQKAEREH